MRLGVQSPLRHAVMSVDIMDYLSSLVAGRDVLCRADRGGEGAISASRFDNQKNPPTWTCCSYSNLATLNVTSPAMNPLLVTRGTYQS